MKKKCQVLSMVFLINTFLSAESSFGQQQINNPGFEDWEEIRSEVFEPLHWNSIKNTDGGMATNRMAPEVISVENTAHSGLHSVRLENKETMGIIANGMLTNGAIHGNIDKEKSYIYTDSADARFSTPFTSRPDSITGWYRYIPKENDSALVGILLHDHYVTMPDHGTRSCWVGGVKVMLGATPGDQWRRFSAPLAYFKATSPEHLLIVLSSGNRKNAIEGSVAYFDDLQLIYNKK